MVTRLQHPARAARPRVRDELAVSPLSCHRALTLFKQRQWEPSLHRREHADPHHAATPGNARMAALKSAALPYKK